MEMSRWRVTMRTSEGPPLWWRRDYLGKGTGSVMLGVNRFIWSVDLEVNEEDDLVPFEGGVTRTLKEAKEMVDEAFALIEAY